MVAYLIFRSSRAGKRQVALVVDADPTLIVAVLIACIFIPGPATLIGDKLWWPGH
jgi:hypothetical protein